MKKEIADKWIAALRSGEYKQGIGELHDTGNNSYCCLGVLCKVMDSPIKEGQSFLSLEAQKQANMRTGHGDFHSPDNLVMLNDSGLASFDDIADIIETEWENL